MPGLKSSGSPTHYRPDIDGLRAIAVLSVVGYHAFPRAVVGGFTGVDIFFVISGFLISGLIYQDEKLARFTFTRFYARRFRRIFPALIVVLAACLIYGWFALAPDEYRELGKQAAAGAGFVSNVLQWLQSGYFDQQAAAKPLLHLWSLGVEEQFYFAWPIVIVLVYRRSRALLWTCCGIIAASFITCIVTTRADPSAAFYLPMSRFWELLLGALLAYRVAERDTLRDRAGAGLAGNRADLVSWVGLGLVLTGFSMIGPTAAFPGWWALLPALGTVCLLAVPEAWFNRTVLSARPLVLVGLISYPLYLWHWVILTFVRISNAGAEPPHAWRVAAIAASFLLAWLTYALVEKPIRFGLNRDALPRGLVAVMAVCAAAAGVVWLTNGAAFRYPSEVRELAAFNYDHEREFHEHAYRDGSCFMSAKQTFADIGAQCVDRTGDGPLVVLWGDSHAASLYPGLRAGLGLEKFRIAQFTASGCPPLIDLASEHRKNCRSFNESVMAALPALKPDVIILECHWALYAGINGLPRFDPAALRETVLAIQRLGVRRIIVMGSLPTWQIYQPRVAFKVWQQTHGLRDRTTEFLDPAPFAADRRVRAALEGTSAEFVSPVDLMCGKSGCLISADSSRAVPMTWDNDHLSIAGSVWLASHAFQAALNAQGTQR